MSDFNKLKESNSVNINPEFSHGNTRYGERGEEVKNSMASAKKTRFAEFENISAIDGKGINQRSNEESNNRHDADLRMLTNSDAIIGMIPYNHIRDIFQKKQW